MDLVQRAKSIMLQPKETWQEIKGEETTIGQLYTSYAMILAAIPAVASLIGMTVVGMSMPLVGTIRQPIMNGIGSAVLQYALTLVGIYIAAFVANALAPTFNSKKDMVAAMKLVVFSYTPAWIVSVLCVIPLLSLLVFIGSIYSLHVFYLGLPVMMETPAEKRLPYFVVVVVVTILVGFVVGIISHAVLASGHMAMTAPMFNN
jgi:hypothetical protein